MERKESPMLTMVMFVTDVRKQHCLSGCTKVTRITLDSSQKEFMTIERNKAGLVTA